MKSSALIAALQSLVAKHGDIDCVYRDLDTRYYFEIDGDALELQRLGNGEVRVSIAPIGDYHSPQASDDVIDDPHLGL